MKLKSILLESATGRINVYHGDNHNTRHLDPAFMDNGNNQEGIGIYFSNNKGTAVHYGKHIVSATIDLSNFIPSRDSVEDHLSVEQVRAMLHDMWDYNNEDLFYWVSDWFMVEEPSDVTEDHVDALAENLLSDQVRNFQIDLAEHFGVEKMVRAWNEHTGIDGTYNNNTDDETWFAIINTDIEITVLQ